GGAAAAQQRGQDGAELADEREGHSRSKECRGAEPDEGQVDLEPEHHPGERAGQEDDQERAVADEVDAVEERPELEGRRNERGERFGEKGAEPPEGLDDCDRPATDGVEGAQRRGERPVRHAPGGRFPAPRAGSTGRTGGTSGRRPAGSLSRSTTHPPTSRRRADSSEDS